MRRRGAILRAFRAACRHADEALVRLSLPVSARIGPRVDDEFECVLAGSLPFLKPLIDDPMTLARAGSILERGVEHSGRLLPLDENTWRRDPVSGREMPDRHFLGICFEPGSMPDPVPYWDLVRLSMLPVLGAAFHATGDARFAAGIDRIVSTWSEACPFGRGAAWAAGLEVGLRAVNLVLADILVRGRGWRTDGLRRLLWAHTAYLWHMEAVRRRGPANNHLLGAMAGLIAGSSVFRGARARRMLARASIVLGDGILAQFRSDGGGVESSTPYHHFSLEASLLAAAFAGAAESRRPGSTGRLTGEKVMERLLEASRFCSDLAVLLGAAPRLGDGSGIWITPPGPPAGTEPDDPVRIAGLAGAILGGMDAGGAEGFTHVLREQSGILLVKTPGYGACLTAMPREPGFGGHAHRDIGSILITRGGSPLVCDPGTFCYMTDPGLRSLYRSTASHNTLLLDGREQVEPDGDGLFSRMPPFQARVEPSGTDGRTWSVFHDGYRRIGVELLERRVTFHEDRIVTRDIISSRHPHSVEILLHLAPGVEAAAGGDGSVRLLAGGLARAILIPSAGLVPTVSEYAYSPRYLARESALLISMKGRTDGADCGFSFEIRFPEAG